VCLDHVASFIVNPNDGTVRAAVVLGVANGVFDCAGSGIPERRTAKRPKLDLLRAMLARSDLIYCCVPTHLVIVVPTIKNCLARIRT
jgi:hypothetical protein